VKGLDDAIQLDLQSLSNRYFSWLVVSCVIVVVGVALEGPEVLDEMWPEVFRIFSGRWMKKVGLLGWLLVVLGVTGEVFFEALHHRVEGQMQMFDQTLLWDAQVHAGDAENSAKGAAAAASRAKTEADDATASAIHANVKSLAAAHASIQALTDANEAKKAAQRVQGAIEWINSFEVKFVYEQPGEEIPWHMEYTPGQDFPEHLLRSPARYLLPAVHCNNNRQEYYLTLVDAIADKGLVTFTYILRFPQSMIGSKVGTLDDCFAVTLPPLRLVEPDKGRTVQDLVKVKMVTMEMYINNRDIVDVPMTFYVDGYWQHMLHREDPILRWEFNKKRPFVSDIFRAKE
jgi:hypothetical protein